MKKHILIIALMLITSVLITLFTITKYTPYYTETEFTQETDNYEKTYLIKDYNGQIAVFYEKNNIPLEVYNIFTNSLPGTDAERIKSGIILSENELNDFISEYTS